MTRPHGWIYTTSRDMTHALAVHLYMIETTSCAPPQHYRAAALNLSESLFWLSLPLLMAGMVGIEPATDPARGSRR